MRIKILSILILGLLVTNVFSQSSSLDLNAPIPTDPKVRIGKLENGMTYYIRQNKKPEKRVEPDSGLIT